MTRLNETFPELQHMKTAPSVLYYEGNRALLKRPKISIVGTRRPSQYTKEITYALASKLAMRGVCIVSGAAMGVDALAHKGAGCNHTIAVMANGLDIVYPKVNRHLIENIASEGLVLSQFDEGFKATRWSFVVRNELVVALGDVLIVTQADANSGTMRSVAYAQAMGKPIYVLPHRLGESEGTQQLLRQGSAEAIYDVEAFTAGFGSTKSTCPSDELLEYCTRGVRYEEALARYGERIFEYELEGRIRIENGNVYVA
ncbi:MAG: DNA-processing protein DprA [Sulfurimonas sp.]|nr:MAG: DNA-processing protein DprA [Sulfurimonas sp.]